MSRDLTFVAAAIEVLKRDKVAQHEREITFKIGEYGLRELTGQTPHQTLAGALSIYAKSQVNPVIRKVAPATWAYINKEETSNDLQHLGARIVELERERSQSVLRQTLNQIIEKCRAVPDDAVANKLKQLAIKLQRIRNQVGNVQNLHIGDSQVRNSTVIVGMTGHGKSSMLNSLLRLGSPRLAQIDNVTGGYLWNDPERPSANQTYLLRLAINDVESELALLGLGVDEQYDFLRAACNGYDVHSPHREIVQDIDAIVAQEQEIEDILYARLEGGWRTMQSRKVDHFPFLLPTAINSTQSTTPFATHMRYGALPAAIVIFKSEQELENDIAYFESEFPDRHGPQVWRKAREYIQRRFQVTIGAGYNLTADRVHLRNALSEMQKDVAFSLAVNRRILFFPDAALKGGCERVDAPGSGDLNGICRRNLEQLMRGANQIVCLLQKGLENDESLNTLLRSCGIYERLLTDPLNHSILLVQMVEKTHQYPDSLEELELFVQENDTSDSHNGANSLFQRGLNEARQRLGEEKTYDNDRCQPKMVRLFPYLFVAQCMKYQSLAGPEHKVQRADLLKRMELSGGLTFLGDLHKLSYGYELRATDHFLKDAESLMEFMPEALRRRIQRPLDRIQLMHANLSTITIEAAASHKIGRTLVKTGNSIFPNAQGNDFDCILKCQLYEEGDLGGKMIQCDCCSHWYHLECVGLPDRDYSNFHWDCAKPECQAQDTQQAAVALRAESLPKRIRRQ